MQDSKFVFPRRGWCSCLFTPLMTTGCPFTRSCFGAFEIMRIPTCDDSQSIIWPDASLRVTTRVYKFGCKAKNMRKMLVELIMHRYIKISDHIANSTSYYICYLSYHITKIRTLCIINIKTSVVCPKTSK